MEEITLPYYVRLQNTIPIPIQQVEPPQTFFFTALFVVGIAIGMILFQLTENSYKDKRTQ